MDLPGYLRARGEGGGGGLGLGWLLAIALCGGILFFAAVGYLLAWRLKMRAQPCTTRVYAADQPAADEDNPTGTGPCGPLQSSSTNVLSKKRFLRSDSSMSRLSSRLSLNNVAVWQPPVLPPLPTHSGSFLGVGRRRSRTGVDDGEEEHGPTMQRRSWRDSWLRRDSWLAMMMMGGPTLPDVSNEAEKGELAARREVETVEEQQPKPKPQEDERPRNEIQVQKKRPSRPPLMTSQTAPELGMQEDDEPPRGRSRLAGQPPRREYREPQRPAATYQREETQQKQQEQQRWEQEEQRKRQERQQKQYEQQLYLRRVRASATETDLRDILKSTEQRLRDGTSRSPVKTPRSSPTKGSPTKTPRSCRTGSSTKTAGRMTPSPSKRSAKEGTPPTAKTHSRNASVSSIGSAANSLIRAATEELELQGGLSSPSRLRGKERDPPQFDTRQTLQQKQKPPPQTQQQQRRRSKSLDSDVSSCLSTLYSVGEPEEEDSGKLLATQHDDPFVEKRRLHQQNGVVKKSSWEGRQQQQLTGPRPLRRTKTLDSGYLSGMAIDESAIPAPLRTISVNSHLGRAGRQGNEKRNSVRLSVVLQPPQKTQSEDVKPKTSSIEALKRTSLSEAPSESSIVSESAYTDVSVGDTSEDTIMADELQAHKRATSSVSSIGTPTKNGRSLDLSSSPLDEREVLSMLMQSARPRRDLPMPPSQITLNGETNMATPLSPRPRSKQQSLPPSRRGSIASTSSSNYDQVPINTIAEDDDGRSDFLPRRATTSGVGNALLGAAHSVGSTVAELRRMNSVASSYSVASVASIIGDTLGESPTLHSLRGGGFPPSGTNSKNEKNETTGMRNYLNLGGSGQLQGKGSSSGQRKEQLQQRPQQRPQQRQSRHGRNQSRSGIPICMDRKGKSDGKENHAPSQRTVRFEVPSGSGLREGRQGLNLVPPLASSTRNTAGMTAAELQRASVDSVGLYDKDGFLKNSPDRDAVTKGGCLRM